MMATLAQPYHIPGVKGLVKKLSRLSVKCHRIYAKANHELMGNLLAERAIPAPPFNITGIDLLGLAREDPGGQGGAIAPVFSWRETTNDKRERCQDEIASDTCISRMRNYIGSNFGGMV